MSEIVYSDDDETIIPWASKIIDFNPRPDATGFGLYENGKLKAAVIWDGFSDCDCNIHVASDGTDNWLRRKFLVTAFMHPFKQWGFRRVTALVPAKNTKALKFDRHLGFKDEGYLKHALPDDDLVILGMLREDCRFIPKDLREGKIK